MGFLRKGLIVNLYFLLKEDVWSRRIKKREYTWLQGDFWQGKKSRIMFFFIYDVGICYIYLSLTLDTAKFKQLNNSNMLFLLLNYIILISSLSVDRRILEEPGEPSWLALGANISEI